MSKPSYKKFSTFNPKFVDKQHIGKKEIAEELVTKAFATVSSGDIDDIKKMVSQNNTTLNMRNETGESLVHAVLRSENPKLSQDDKYELCVYLVRNGSPTGSFDKNNVTPLHLASKEQNLKLVKFLLETGSEINHQDNQNMTALHYVVQADSFPCKPRKKVKSMIPKPKTDMTLNMKMLTINIIEILHHQIFEKYIKGITSTINKYDIMAIGRINSIKDNYLEQILKIIEDDSLEEENKSKSVEKRQFDLHNEVENTIKQSLNESISKMDIKPDIDQGWGPDNINTILPRNNLNEHLQNEKNTTFASIRDTLSTLSVMNNASQDMITKMYESYEHIQNAIDHNYHMRYNAFTYNSGIGSENDVSLTENQLSDIISHENKDMYYHEIGVHGKVDNRDGRFQLACGRDVPKVLLGTKNERDEWNRITARITTYFLPVVNNRGNDAHGNTRESDLANSAYVAKGRDTREIERNINASKNPADANKDINDVTNNILTRYIVGTNLAGGPVSFLFITKLSHALHRIDIYTDALRRNFNTLAGQVHNCNYHGKVIENVNRIIIQAVNIALNIVRAKSEEQYIRQQISELTNALQSKTRNHKNHPFHYTMEYALENVNSLNTVVTEIYQSLDAEYNNLNTLFGNLSSVLTHVNVKVAADSIQSYFRIGADGIKDDSNITYNDLYKISLGHVKSLPSFSEFSKLVGGDSIDDTDENNVRESVNKAVKNFANSINSESFTIYLSNTSNIEIDTICPGHSRFINVLPSHIRTIADDPYNLNSGDDPLTDAGGIIGGGGVSNIDISHQKDKIRNHQVAQSGFILPKNLKDANNGAGSLVADVSNIRTNKVDIVNNGEGLGTLLNAAIDDTNGNIGFDRAVDMKIQDGTLESVRPLLGTFIYNIKYILIQNILKLYNNDTTKGYPAARTSILNPGNTKDKKIIDDINHIKSEIDITIKSVYNITDSKKHLYSIVAKIADELINSHIINSIKKTSITISKQILKDNSPTVDRERFAPYNRMFIDKKDTGFKLNFNTLFDEIIEGFLMRRNAKAYTSLKYSGKIMDDESPVSDQEKVYNMDYKQTNEINEYNCYKINSGLVKHLIKNGADQNKKDISRKTPLFYAIDMLNPKIIQTLINNNARVSSISVIDNIGNTPLKHAVNIYKQHNSYFIPSTDGVYYKEILDKMYRHMLDDIKTSIRSKDDFKNNVIRNVDLAFPQLIVMLNNLFSFDMKMYIRDWNFDDYHDLCALMKKHKIITKYCDDNTPAFLDIDDNEIHNIVSGNTNIEPLVDKKSLMKSSKEETDDEINRIKSVIDSLKKEKSFIERKRLDRFNKGYVKHLNRQVSNMERKINSMKSSLKNERAEIKNINTNITSYTDIKVDDIKRRITNFLGGGRDGYFDYSSETSTQAVIQFYKNIFNKIVNNINLRGSSNDYDGHEDYLGYNNMWRSYVTSEDRLRTMDNLHFSLLHLENRLLDKVESDPIDTAMGFKKISKVYSNIIVPFIKDYEELSDDTMIDNYALHSVINIITHIVRHIVATSMYSAIIKTVIMYINSISPSEADAAEKRTTNIFKSKQEYRSYVVKVIDNLLGLGNSSTFPPKLARYVVGEIPKMTVKHVLKIYNDDYDSSKKISNFDDIFSPILGIIKSNGVIMIDDDSSLIKNLRDVILPYYKEMYTIIIPKMKILSDNYFRYLMNESKYVEIMNILLQKSVAETN